MSQAELTRWMWWHADQHYHKYKLTERETAKGTRWFWVAEWVTDDEWKDLKHHQMGPYRTRKDALAVPADLP